MSTEVASMYASLGVRADGMKQGLKDAKDGMKSLKDDFKSGMEAIGAVTAAAGLTIVGMKKIMDFGKEGAMIKLTESRFDRLSRSIGATADVLKNDLKRATRGMLSDSEMVAGATNFMILGLAKTRDEAVRLTRVASALGMNMNQLVLTLTNQTTMRFDALGMSVDGFDEKVNRLKATGLSAGDAFKKAFLQQAEDQLSKVGDAADSDAAAFIRLDTSIKNLEDTLKVMLSPTLGRIAEGLVRILDGGNELVGMYNAQERAVYNTSRSYADYMESIEGPTQALRLLDDQAARSIRAAFGFKNMNELLTASEYEQAKATDQATEKARALIPVYNEIEDRWSGMAQANARFAEQRRKDMAAQAIQSGLYEMQLNGLGNIDQAERDYTRRLEAEADATRRANRLTLARNDGLNGLNDTYMKLMGAQQQLAQAQEAWGKQVGGDVAGALDKARLGADNYRTALRIIDETMGTSFGRQEDYKNQLTDLVKNFDPKNPEEFRQGLKDLASGFEDLSDPINTAREKIADLGRDLSYLQGQHFRTYVDVVMAVQNAVGGGGGPSDHRNPNAPGKHAGGGVAQGWSWVGENGPELVNFGSPSRVMTNAESKSIAGGNNFVMNVYNSKVREEDLTDQFALMRARAHMVT